MLHGLDHPRSPEVRREALETLEIRASVVIRVRVHESVNGDLGHGAPRAQVGPEYVSDLTCKGVRILTRARVHRLVSADEPVGVHIHSQRKHEEPSRHRCPDLLIRPVTRMKVGGQVRRQGLALFERLHDYVLPLLGGLDRVVSYERSHTVRRKRRAEETDFAPVRMSVAEEEAEEARTWLQ